MTPDADGWSNSWSGEGSGEIVREAGERCGSRGFATDNPNDGCKLEKGHIGEHVYDGMERPEHTASNPDCSRDIVDRIILAYQKHPVEVAEACDKLIDPSGALLGWVRQAALAPTNEN